MRQGLFPLRGEVWLAELDPTRGHEQAGRRPVLIISDNIFNRGPADLVIAVPITGTLRGIATHPVVRPPEGGLRTPSAILCDAVRSISKDRLVRHWGRLGESTMDQVEESLRILMGL